MSKISHSAYKKYLTCAKMYDHYYNSKLRPTGTSSSLLFGSAIDEALNALLLKIGDPYQIFRDNFTFEMMQDIEWHKDDYDPTIFTKEQTEELLLHNKDYKTWASLRVKGRMLLDAYIRDIYPKITKVYKVQKELEGRKGFIDAIVEMEGFGKVLLDNKTSTRPYKRDALENDTQLHLYAEYEKVDYIGFAVMIKKINQNRRCEKCGARSYSSHKTCPQPVNGDRCHGKWNYSPEAETQLMIGKKIPAQTKVLMKSITDVESQIENGIFPMNLGACRSYFGKVCPYLEKCLHNKENGLEYKKETKEKLKDEQD